MSAIMIVITLGIGVIIGSLIPYYKFSGVILRFLMDNFPGFIRSRGTSGHANSIIKDTHLEASLRGPWGNQDYQLHIPYSHKLANKMRMFEFSIVDYPYNRKRLMIVPGVPPMFKPSQLGYRYIEAYNFHTEQTTNIMDSDIVEFFDKLVSANE